MGENAFLLSRVEKDWVFCEKEEDGRIERSPTSVLDIKADAIAENQSIEIDRMFGII